MGAEGKKEKWLGRALVEGAIAGVVAPVVVLVIVTAASGHLQELFREPSCADPKDLTLIRPSAATASTPVYEDVYNEQPVSYPPENAIDTNTGTAWVEGAEGYGVGASITFAFGEQRDIRLICVVNGYALNEDRYRANGRVRQFDVTTDQGEKTAVLSDLPVDEITTFQRLRLPEGPTRSVTLKIGSTSSMGGSQAATDTAVSEVEFWGH